MADGGGLADHLAGYIGIVGGADDDAALLGGQHADHLGHLAARAHHDAARVHLDGGQLAVAAVAHNNQVPLGDGALHVLGAARADADAPLHIPALNVPHQHGAVQCVHHVLIAGAGLGQDGDVRHLHIGGGDVLDGDEPLEVPVLIHHAQGVDLLVPHIGPGPAHGHLPVHSGDRADIHIVFIFQTVFQHVKLQYSHHADDDLLHARIELLEDLDGSLLGDLADSLDKLFSFHGVHLAYPGKVLRRKGGNPLKPEFSAGHTDCIPDGKDSRVKDADDISRIGLFHHMTIRGHHLLRLGKPHFFISLYVINLLGCVKLSGTDAHKGDSVPVSFVHIGLNLKDKRRKRLLNGIDKTLV